MITSFQLDNAQILNLEYSSKCTAAR